MNNEILTDIVDGFNSTEENRPKLEEAVGMVLTKAAERGYVVVAASPMIATDYNDFENTVLAHLTPSTDKVLASELEASDINGQAVIHALRAKGWLILPPK
jgi:hypothetical protein